MTVRVVAHGAGVVRILRLESVRQACADKAERVAQAASVGDLTYGVRSEIGPHRARAATITEGARTNAHELAHHDLARLIDHAR